MHLFIISLTLLILSNLSAGLVRPKFRDVTKQVGIDITPEGPGTSRKLLKYGGPAIADLDRDGFYDLIFVHHGPTSAELYFNERDGTFTKSTFRSRRDNHATTPFRVPSISDGLFTLIPGGNNGIRPNSPEVYRIAKNRTITNIVTELGLDKFTGRGRTVVVMPLQTRDTNPDIVYLNSAADPVSCPGCTDPQYDPYEYTTRFRPYRTRKLGGFKPNADNSVGLAVDIDGDRRMELVTWRTLHIHKLVGFFRFRDVTKSVFGDNANAEAVAAVAEIDFDNDGDFDLYVAREKSGVRQSLEGKTFPDLLLENRGGKFVNVAVQAGIPQDTVSRGVTVGDFNNDGFMDIYVTVFRGKPDMLLMNLGNGKFKRFDIGIGKQGAFGDNAMAVDYDMDGRVDLVRSEGDWTFRQWGGQFRILRNVRTKRRLGNYIKVKVGSVGEQTSQHAVVVVHAGGRRQMQRVGPAGVQISHSYFDTLHFGIGRKKKVFVTVTWLNGVVRRRKVRAGITAAFGIY